jgi:hypothetical protein
MPLLLRSHSRESERKVKLARLQIDEALSKLADVLDKVEDQTSEAKEQLDERRAG